MLWHNGKGWPLAAPEVFGERHRIVRLKAVLRRFIGEGSVLEILLAFG